MPEILAIATTELSSGEFTLGVADAVTLSLKFPSTGAGTSAQALVLLKTSSTSFVQIGSLTLNEPAKVLAAPGTFKVTRLACTSAFGVDKV